ncbi:uncharacterized protein LOC113304087 [Papaver somniferum]|uniref:uncharacterized protein LOC113304087 n=1 Tax=Papaver somniferum TaxID=3469 RepID=UPI000E7033BE|nr:uncharacterized protein LOC113304087 [Papaver somniferum]
MVALVKSSGLWSGIEAMQKSYDVVIVCNFRERLWPETMTFQLPFSKMTMIPDDAKEISGLALEEKAVYEGFNNTLPYDELYVLDNHCLGWSKYQAEEESEIGGPPSAKREVIQPVEHHETFNKSRKINLVRLREKFEDSDRKTKNGEIVMDAERARHTAIAYLLHALGTVFFSRFLRK